MDKQRKWQQCLFSGFIFLCAFVACYKMEQTSSAVIAGVTLLAAPIAYAYRYILMLAVALPVFAALPFCHGEQHPDA